MLIHIAAAGLLAIIAQFLLSIGQSLTKHRLDIDVMTCDVRGRVVRVIELGTTFGIVIPSFSLGALV